MRAVWTYPVVAVFSVAWPYSASPLAGPMSVPVAVGTCEITGTSAGRLTLREEGFPIVLPDPSDLHLGAALRGVAGRATRWIEAPGLVVLTSVMDYQSGARTEYQATSERLSDEETNALVADLTAALAVLTANVFTKFADVRTEFTHAGETVNVMRPGQIVVGRYRGVRDQLKTVGVGGRFRSGRAIRSGTVFLDDGFDRASSRRALSRTHELGHALGYDHVESRPSIMNPRIGAEVTEYDRLAALVAFGNATLTAPPHSCPSSLEPPSRH